MRSGIGICHNRGKRLRRRRRRIDGWNLGGQTAKMLKKIIKSGKNEEHADRMDWKVLHASWSQ